MMQWISAADTHQGNHRKRNEDSIFSCIEQRLWAVADGMGGHNAGDYASRHIVNALSQLDFSTVAAAQQPNFANNEKTSEISFFVDEIEDCILAANDHLRNHARQHCAGNTVGSTVVVLTSYETLGVVLWAGDSRLYRMRGHNIELVTRDHNPIADLLDIGGVSEDEAEHCDTHIVTRAVGGQPDLHLDVALFDIEPGDTMLLCTDGLYRELSADHIKSALQGDVAAAVSTMMNETLARDARDNVSLVVVRAQ